MKAEAWNDTDFDAVPSVRQRLQEEEERKAEERQMRPKAAHGLYDIVRELEA